MTATACIDGHFTCRTCGQARPCADFGAADSARGHRLQCNDCTRSHRTEQRHAPQPGQPVPCYWCGTPFVPTHDRKTYCSTDCAYAGKSKPESSRVHFFICPGCERPYSSRRSGRKYCSKECSWRHLYPRYLVQPRSAECADCGATYTQTHGTNIRCAPCVAARTDALRHVSKALRRTRQRSNKGWEAVSRRAVYERDEWTCYLCGQHVDREAATTDPLYPTLDHIVPLALGGPHSMDNLRLACRGCNLAKGASLLVSPPLVRGERAS